MTKSQLAVKMNSGLNNCVSEDGEGILLSMCDGQTQSGLQRDGDQRCAVSITHEENTLLTHLYSPSVLRDLILTQSKTRNMFTVQSPISAVYSAGGGTNGEHLIGQKI